MTDLASTLHHGLVSRLKLRHLQLLQQIVQHRTLSRVALEARLSQPAITKSLHEIEDIFMTRLFDRTSRGLKPTVAGEAVVAYALNALADTQSTARTLSAIDAGLSGRVRIGVTPQVPSALLNAALAHLLEQTPRVAVMAREGTTDDLVQAIAAREIDCAIGRSFDGEPAEIVQWAILEQEACLVVAAKSRARLAKAPLDWGKLAALDWILPPANTPMRRTFNTIFVGAGVQPPFPIVETVSIKTIETVLRAEPNAVTILARDVVDEMSSACAALPHRLSWKLPPVSFFVARHLHAQPGLRALAAAVTAAARGLARPEDALAQNSRPA